VAGSTWVNRLYAMTGQADASEEGIFDKDDHRLFWDFPAFPRHLEDHDVSWRWYSHDPATLRLADSRYRSYRWTTERDHFRFFDRKAVGKFTREVEDLIVDEDDSFLDDVRHGELPAVSWIDPNFIDLSLFERNSNDDHPPSDVHMGQELVLTAFRALVEGDKSQFDRTLFVVTYDEHGGFFDHIPPPPAEDGNPDFRTHGVRVPAFVVSPLVEPCTVSHMLFDHTSLIRTILLRFAPDAADAMGLRVSNANHLGHLLTRDTPAPVADYSSLVTSLASLRAAGAAAAKLAPPAPPERPAAPPLTGFPAEMAQAATLLRGGDGGVPAGRP
jgi:phospholipase C